MIWSSQTIQIKNVVYLRIKNKETVCPLLIPTRNARTHSPTQRWAPRQRRSSWSHEDRDPFPNSAMGTSAEALVLGSRGDRDPFPNSAMGTSAEALVLGSRGDRLLSFFYASLQRESNQGSKTGRRQAWLDVRLPVPDSTAVQYKIQEGLYEHTVRIKPGTQ